MHRASRKVLLLGGTTLALVAVPAVSAQAKVLHITGQTSTITPSSAVTSFLAAHKVSVTAIGPATISNGSVTLPIVGGTVKTPNLNGKLINAGGLRFTRNGHSITLSDFAATRHGRTNAVTAKVDGRRVTVAHATGVHLTVSGKTGTITGELRLSAGAARAIDRFAGHKLVKAGADLGSFTSTVTVA
jgi:hypothetical protein